MSESFSIGDDVSTLVAVVIPAILLLIVPSLFWRGSVIGNPTNVGGDVPSTLFLQPLAFLKHLVSQKIGINLTGTDTFLPYFSIALIAVILNSLGLDSQLVVAGLVLALTYLGVFVLMTSLLPKREVLIARLAASVGSSVAVLAPLTQISFTDWEPRLYLYPLTPWLLFSIVSYVRTGHNKYVVAGIAMTIASSSAISDIPGSLPAFLLIAILLVVLVPYYFTEKWVSARRLLGFSAIVILSNFFWLLPFVVGLFAGQAQATFATSESGKQAALALVAALIPYQQLSNVLELRTSELLMTSNNWPELSFSSWFQRLSIIGYVPFAFTFGGFFTALLSSQVRRLKRVPILALFLVAMLMLALFSLRFPPGAKQLFDFLTLHLPGWVAAKNFYGTLVIPFVLSVAFATAAGFYVVVTFFRRSLAVSTALILVLLLALYGAPLFSGDAYRVPYFDGSPANRVVSGLPTGYTTLMSRIENSGGAPTLSLPLLEPGWTYLVGNSRQALDTYIGIPPLYFLDAVSNYTGVASYGTPESPDLQTDLQDSILNGKADTFARVTEMLGVRWVISDLSVVRQYDFHFVNVLPSANAALLFSNAVERQLDTKSVEIAGRYRLLSIKQSSKNSVVSIDVRSTFSKSPNGIDQVAKGAYTGPLRESCPDVVGGSSVHDASEVSALVKRPIVAGKCFVAFRVPYSSQWSANLIENGKTFPLQNQKAYGFANGFVLPSLSPGTVRIIFSNSYSRIDTLGVAGSSAAVVILVTCVLFEIRNQRRSKYGKFDHSELVRTYEK